MRAVCQAAQDGVYMPMIVVAYSRLTSVLDVQAGPSGRYADLPRVDCAGLHWSIRDWKRCTYPLCISRTVTLTFLCLRFRYCASVSFTVRVPCTGADPTFLAVFVIIEYLAYTWYTLSYIPYARAAVLKLFGM